MEMPVNIDLITRSDAAYCFVSASHRYNLPPESLLSLAMVEGGKVGTQSLNKNGTHDLGLMQINTLWLKQVSPLSSYVNAGGLVNDICTNVHAAAWILASNMSRAKGDIWRAVGMYHSPGNEQLAKKYIQKVNSRLPLARKILSDVPEYQRYISAFYPVNGVAQAGR